jgi:radical SAM protein with 4Fe4S-binding SPASM domain
MCPNKDLPDSEKGAMSWEIFKKTIDEAASFAFDLTLHHRGESLLHPRAGEFIRYAATKGKHTNLHTNGTLLDKKISEELVNSGLSRLSLSFDGFEKSDYERIRRGAQFEQVVENIRYLLSYRNSTAKKLPVVAVELIELSDSQVNADKKRKFMEDFNKYGLDELIIKKPHNWGGYLKSETTGNNYAPCTFLWNALLVLWNGDVVPCAQDFFARQVIGNVLEKSLSQIWNDKPIQAIRQGLIEKRYQDFPVCSGCDRLWRETFLGIPKEYLKQMIFHKMP